MTVILVGMAATLVRDAVGAQQYRRITETRWPHRRLRAQIGRAGESSFRACSGRSARRESHGRLSVGITVTAGTAAVPQRSIPDAGGRPDVLDAQCRHLAGCLGVA